jgi:hypothetical protein
MPSKSWFLQIYSVGCKPKMPILFTDRDELCAFIDEFRGSGSSGAVTVYLAESGTNREEQAFDELGVKLSLLS